MDIFSLFSQDYAAGPITRQKGVRISLSPLVMPRREGQSISALQRPRSRTALHVSGSQSHSPFLTSEWSSLWCVKITSAEGCLDAWLHPASMRDSF